MPKQPSRMRSANSPFSWGDCVSPNIAGKKVFIMVFIIKGFNKLILGISPVQREYGNLFSCRLSTEQPCFHA